MKPPIINSDPAYMTLILFIISLVLPSISIEHDYIDYGEFYRGWDVLLSGFLGLLDGTAAWFANPIFIIAFIYRNKRPQTSFLLSIAACVLAVSSFCYARIWNDGDEAIRITGYREGFYVWLSAFVLLTAFNIKAITKREAFA